MKTSWKDYLLGKTNEPEVEPETHTQTPAPGRFLNRWPTAFLLAGSAIMGATALALWNRRAIREMRAQIDALSREKPESGADGEIV